MTSKKSRPVAVKPAPAAEHPGRKVAGGGAGGAVVGALVGGPIGAVVGGLIGSALGAGSAYSAPDAPAKTKVKQAVTTTAKKAVKKTKAAVAKGKTAAKKTVATAKKKTTQTKTAVKKTVAKAKKKVAAKTKRTR